MQKHLAERMAFKVRWEAQRRRGDGTRSSVNMRCSAPKSGAPQPGRSAGMLRPAAFYRTAAEPCPAAAPRLHAGTHR